MKRIIYFAPLLLLLLLVPACKKDKVACTTCPSNGADCEDVQNVKHFFYFKVGSWWVYEEETSGARDSVYVTEAIENVSNYNFDVRVYSTYQDYYYHFWPQLTVSSSCPSNGVICKRCVQIKRSKYKPGDFVGEATCFIFLPILGAKDYNSNSAFENNYIHVSTVMDTFQNSSLFYNRTVKMFEDNTYMEGAQPTNHYFSENVGLVRKELLDSNQVWNLVDYYIAP